MMILLRNLMMHFLKIMFSLFMTEDFFESNFLIPVPGV